MKVKALHVPMGTRLECITRYSYKVRSNEGPWDEQEIEWRIWIAIKNKQVPPDKYEGTYLMLHTDGSIVQCTTDEPEMEVMEATS